MSRVVLRHPLLLWLVSAAGASGCASEGGSVAGPPAGTVPVGLEQVASGLDFPLYLTAPPGDSARLFVVQKGGAIRVIDHGALFPDPFLDLSAKVSTGGEQGLLGLAFAPDYDSSGRFVVHYTDANGNTRVSLFRVSTDPSRADPASETLLFAATQPFSNHNGGQILFGPDGYLYLGLGDGGSAGDPQGRGQDLGEPLGSILRLSIAAAPATAPADNPFVGRTGARPEIWNYGLRNPWRFSFDRTTGDLYIADVGQSAWEEVDVSTAAAGAGKGINFGWNIMEGNHCYQASSCDRAGLAPAVLEYDHGQGCSISGGYVYRGAAIPALQGHYFYADYCQGWVRSFRYADGGVSDEADWPTLRPGGSVPSFGEDAAGELYVVSAEGTVWKIVPR
jgi:glucose/arabinose dehydrogenase